jgi:outer membrane receptor protein involved in Fe transport
MNTSRAALSRALSNTSLAALALALLAAGPALAQTAPAAPEAAPAPEAEEEPEVVVVTATKREQTLQEVPVAVSVTSGAAIERAQVRDINDLQTLVPSLRVGQLQSSANTNFIIRGFGNGANNAGIESSVGVFIDGVYRSRSASAIGDLPNLQRVEVLRGPQSTLFGKNASAGVISIVTRPPRFDWGGNAELSYGNYNAVVGKADVTGPLSEKVAFSLAGGFNVRDGYAKNLATGTDSNERNRYFLRGQLLWEPSETISFRLIADKDSIDEICCIAANVLDGPTGAVVRALGGRLDSNNPFSYNVFYNFDSTNDIDNSGVSLQGDFEFDKFDVTSITAFRNTSSKANADSDFTSADLIGRNAGTAEIETFTQELRVASNFDGPFNFLLGGYYFDETINTTNALTFGRDFRGYVNFLSGGGVGVLEGLLGLPANTFHQRGQGKFEAFTLENTAWSIFGSVDFDITDRLTFTGGFNYTDDSKSSSSNVTTTDTFSTLDINAIAYGALTNGVTAAQVGGALGLGRSATAAEVAAFAAAQPTAFGAIQAGARAFASATNAASGRPNYQTAAVNPAANLLGLKVLQFLPPFLNYPNSVESGKTADTKWTYSARLAFELNDNINVYASYATGFKASSINLSGDSRPFARDFIAGSPVDNPPPSAIRNAGLAIPNLNAGTRFAGPEDATVIEVGVKAKFDTFAFNLTLFDQTIEGFQSNAFTGTGFALVNAGEQSTKGVEFDSSWSPIDPLTVTFAFTWLDPIYDSFVGSVNGDLSGTQPAGIPELTVNIGGNYVFDFANDHRLTLAADYAWEQDVRLSESFPATYSREVKNLAASATYAFPNGLELVAWGRNLTNAKFLTTIFPGVAQSGTISGYPSQPRTYGVAARMRF